MRSPGVVRVSKKEAKLVDAAVELFKRYGIKRVSVTEVCEAADVSKVTFYKRFANKVELARRVIEVISQRVVAGIDEIVALDVPLPRKVELLVEQRVRMAREWSGDFIDELYHLDPQLGQLVMENWGRARTRYVDVIRQAQASGEMRPDVHAEVALAMLDKLRELGGNEALVQQCGGYERLTRDINNIFYYGMLRRDDTTDGGREGRTKKGRRRSG